MDKNAIELLLALATRDPQAFDQLVRRNSVLALRLTDLILARIKRKGRPKQPDDELIGLWCSVVCSQKAPTRSLRDAAKKYYDSIPRRKRNLAFPAFYARVRGGQQLIDRSKDRAAYSLVDRPTSGSGPATRDPIVAKLAAARDFEARYFSWRLENLQRDQLAAAIGLGARQLPMTRDAVIGPPGLIKRIAQILGVTPVPPRGAHTPRPEEVLLARAGQLLRHIVGQRWDV